MEQWWEEVCSQIATDPKRSTETILQFRESQDAYDVSVGLLMSNLSPLAKFHILSVFQYALFVKRWSRLTIEEHVEVINQIWGFCINELNNPTMPVYVTKKAMQTYAIGLKLLWFSIRSTDRKLDFLTRIVSYCDSRSSPDIGCLFFHSILEEFSFTSRAELGRPLSFHINSHKSFESFGLHVILEFAFLCVTRSLAECCSIIVNSRLESLDGSIAVCNLAMKLYKDVLGWSNDDSNISLISQDSVSTCISLSKDNSRFVLSSSTINDIIELYLAVRNISVQSHSIMSNTVEFLDSCRNVLLSLVSLRNISNSEDERSFQNFLIERCLFLIESINFVIPEHFLSFIEFGSRESEGLVNILNRLFSCADPSHLLQFIELEHCIQLMGRSITEWTKDITTLVHIQILISRGQQSQAMELVRSSVSVAQSFHAGFEFLEDWRYSCIMSYIEIITMLIERLREECDEAGTNICVNPFFLFMQTISPNLFDILFNCLKNVVLLDTLCNQDEDEDEDQEAISGRTLDDIIRLSCTIGRVNMMASMKLIADSLFHGLTTLQNGRSISVEMLEEFRVSLLFASHLVSEMYSFADSKNLSKESPLLPRFLLVSAFQHHQDFFGQLSAFLQAILMLKDYFLQVMMENRYDSPILSPLLLQVVLKFFAEVYEIFLRVDLQDYPVFFHAICSDILLFRGKLWNETSASLLDLALNVIKIFPSEKELLRSTSDLFSSFSFVSSDLSYVIADLSFFEQLSLVLLGNENASGVSRLNSDSICFIVRGFLSLIVSLNKTSIFHNYCSYLASNFQLHLEFTSDADSRRRRFEQDLSILRGLGCFSIAHSYQHKHSLFEVFDQCLPQIQQLISRIYCNNDGITLIMAQLLSEYTANHILDLNSRSTMILFQTSEAFLSTMKNRLIIINENSHEAEIVFKNEMIGVLLQLLNDLSSKDFLFFDDDDDDDNDDRSHSSGNRSHLHVEEVVSSVLLLGLSIFIELISADNLRQFPETCDKYYSYISFIMNGYMKKFAAILLGMEQGVSVLSTLFQHLLWGCGSVRLSASRMALNAINAITLFQWSELQQHSGFPMASYGPLFDDVMDQLFMMILYPGQSNEVGITWDRLDCCSNALLVLISVSGCGMERVFQKIVAIQSPDYQASVMKCFENLLTHRQVYFANPNNKISREHFNENMIEFVKDIRSLVLTK